MNKRTLTMIWTAIGLPLMYITLNGWISSQAGNILKNIPFNILGESLAERHVAASLIAIIICAPMLWCLIYISSEYKKKSSGKFVNTIPVAFNLQLNTNDFAARLYIYFFGFIFHIFPILAQVHFIRKIFKQAKPIKWKDPDAPIGFWDYSLAWDSLTGKQMFGVDGISFYPFIEPLLLIFILVISVLFTLKLIIANPGYRPSKRKP